MAVYAAFIDRAERILSNSRLVVKFCVLLRNRLLRIIAYSLVKSHRVEASGELLLVQKLSHLLRTVIDVGANKGEWSEMVLAQPSSNIKKLMLIEPGKGVFTIVERKFGKDERCTLFNMGLSDHDGMLAFNEKKGASPTSSFSATLGQDTLATLTPVRKLDSLLKETNFGYVDFLKIDCEGFDFKVISGAYEHIKARQVGIVQFEYNCMWIKAGSTLKAAFDLLLSCNYEVYLLNHKGLSRFDVDFYQEFFNYSNFVAVSPEWKESVRDVIS